jgi:outer membrane protein assembly factor BamB
MSEMASFAGFPPVLFSGGFLIGDDSGHRFLAPVDMAATDARARHWHLDLQNTVGVPAADGKRLYVPLGGPGASLGIIAVDGATGALLWRYALEGMPNEPVSIEPPPMPLRPADRETAPSARGAGAISVP